MTLESVCHRRLLTGQSRENPLAVWAARDLPQSSAAGPQSGPRWEARAISGGHSAEDAESWPPVTARKTELTARKTALAARKTALVARKTTFSTENHTHSTESHTQRGKPHSQRVKTHSHYGKPHWQHRKPHSQHGKPHLQQVANWKTTHTARKITLITANHTQHRKLPHSQHGNHIHSTETTLTARKTALTARKPHSQHGNHTHSTENHIQHGKPHQQRGKPHSPRGNHALSSLWAASIISFGGHCTPQT